MIESVGLGKTLYQMLVRQLKADRDKVTRALPAAARMEVGEADFMHVPWLADFEDELLSFPTGAYDDQVDTLSYAPQIDSETENRQTRFISIDQNQGEVIL